MERKRKTYLAGAIMDLWVKEEKKLPCNIAKMIEAMLKKVLFEILKTESKLAIEETEEEKKRLESVCIHEVIRISRTLSKKRIYTEEMKELMTSIMFYVRMVIEGEDAGEE